MAKNHQAEKIQQLKDIIEELTKNIEEQQERYYSLRNQNDKLEQEKWNYENTLKSIHQLTTRFQFNFGRITDCATPHAKEGK